MFLLLVIVVAMLFQRPLKIELKHQYQAPPSVKEVSDSKEEEEDEPAVPYNLNEVVQNVNEVFMGVEYNESEER